MKTEEKMITRASALDAVLLRGGDWDTVIAAADAAVKPLKTKIKKHTRAFIKTHIAYRTRQKADYFAGIRVDDEKGVIVIKK